MAYLRFFVFAMLLLSAHHLFAQDSLFYSYQFQFKNKSIKLTKEAKAGIDSFVVKGCNRKLVILAGNDRSYVGYQYAWSRIEETKNYLITRHFPEKDIIVSYDDELKSNSAVLRWAQEGEDGPNLIPTPHPVLLQYPPRKWHRKWEQIR